MKSSIRMLFGFLLWGICSCGSTDSDTINSTSPEPDSLKTETETEDSVVAQPEELFDWKKEKWDHTINLHAWIDDPDLEGPTNIRNSPNGKIVLKLPTQESYMVNIIGQDSGWFKISDISFFADEMEIPKGPMWIHSSVLKASTRNYGVEEKLTVYRFPEENENFVHDELIGETSFRFSEYYGDYVHIHYENNGVKNDGWIHQKNICGNPVTTCP